VKLKIKRRNEEGGEGYSRLFQIVADISKMFK